MRGKPVWGRGAGVEQDANRHGSPSSRSMLIQDARRFSEMIRRQASVARSDTQPESAQSRWGASAPPSRPTNNNTKTKRLKLTSVRRCQHGGHLQSRLCRGDDSRQRRPRCHRRHALRMLVRGEGSKRPVSPALSVAEEEDDSASLQDKGGAGWSTMKLNLGGDKTERRWLCGDHR